MIQGTLDAYRGEVMRAERLRALKAILWRLRGPNGEFVGMRGYWAIAFVPEHEALVFDGRDNEEMKLRAYESALGPLTIEILPQAK